MTARELVSSGLKVAIFDSKTVGSESSWAGGGILSPLYPWRENLVLTELTAVSRALHSEIARDLLDKTGIDPEWQQCGMLLLNVDDSEDARKWAKKHNFPIRQTGNDELEHDFSIKLQGCGISLWMPEVAQVRNPELIKALKTYLIQSGVEIFEQTRVNHLNIKAGKLRKIATTKGDFSSESTVVANGAWVSDLLPEIKIRPVRGQMLCYRGVQGFLKQIRLKNSIYLIPRKDGHILVGSTVEEAGFDKATTAEARILLSGKAEDILPGINKFPLVKHWSGLRPATPSGISYICPHPDIDGLYLNTGHFRNGILLAPGSARLVADLILNRPPIVDPDPYQYKAPKSASSNVL